MAATYVKLAEAYYAETNAIGGWTLIGYTAPGEMSSANDFKSVNFEYKGSVTANATVVVDTEKAWSATNNVKLNDCEKGEHWTIKAKWTASTITFESKVDDAANTAKCASLTASFEQIGK